MPNTLRPSVFNKADGWDKVPANELAKAQTEWDMAKAIEEQNRLLRERNNTDHNPYNLNTNYTNYKGGFNKYDWLMMLDVLVSIGSWIYAFEFAKELNLVFPTIVTGVMIIFIIKNYLKS